MGRTWVLHTETKGTGAHIVPLEKATSRSSAAEPVFVPRKPARPAEPEAPQPKPPRRFKVVDIMTRQTLVEDAQARETVGALAGVRSVVDVNVYTWEEERGRWRPLTFAERRALWDLAHPTGVSSRPRTGSGRETSRVTPPS
jgi:hypothetical protein